MLVLGGCAGGGGTAGPSTAGGGTAPPAVYQADVLSVAAQASGLDLTVSVRAGQDDCAGDVVVDVQPAADRVYVTLSYESTDTGAGCGDVEQRQVYVETGDLAGKQIVLNGNTWGADGAGGFVECSPPFGCDPRPADRCDAAWIEYLFTTVEVAPDRSYEVQACDGAWLVLDIDSVPDGCAPPAGESTPAGCAGAASSVRWFAAFVDEQAGWDVVASGVEGGCAPVAGVPAFPNELCASLPPL
ncbi:hypothetical protein GCM10027298_35570 [Epidermidibacterium keratini]